MESEVVPEKETSLEESFEILKRNSKDIYTHSREAFKTFQAILEKYKDETSVFYEQKVQPHNALKKYCIVHGLHSKISIHEFLAFVFEMYGKQHRLDISSRSVQLDNEVAELLGKSVDEWIDLGDFLVLVVDLFESQESHQSLTS